MKFKRESWRDFGASQSVLVDLLKNLSAKIGRAVERESDATNMIEL